MLRKFFSSLFVLGMLVFVCALFIVGILVWNQNQITLQASSNPLFGDGVPEHLQCPQRLIGKYIAEVTREDILKIQAIAEEIVTNYNPKRPVTETWKLHAKKQLDYHANSDPLKRGYRGREDFQLGANRIDWVVQSILDFPEYVRFADFHRWILLKREQRVKEGKTYQTSINPFFADGVPKHLQCPPELIGKYIREVSEEDLLKIKAIAEEVKEKYNPKRASIKLIGPLHEAAMYYSANADPNKKEPHTGANRIDWVIQSILDFPEVLVSDYDPKVRLNFSRSPR